MKSKSLSMILLVLLMLSACEKKSENNLPISIKTVIHLEIEVNESSANCVLQIPGYHLRYILEVYEQGNEGESRKLITRKKQVEADFELQLEQGKQYTLAAWADYVSSGAGDSTLESTEDEFYDTRISLTNVTMKPEKWKLNTLAKDAFCGTYSDFKPEHNNHIITLKRPLAMLNIKGEPSPIAPKSLKVHYPAVYASYNVLSGDVTGSPMSKTSDAIILLGPDGVWAFDYLFVHPLAEGVNYQEGSSLYDISIDLFASGDVPGSVSKHYSVGGVPFSPNCRTNLIFPTSSENESSINIVVDPDFNVPEVEDYHPFIISSYIRPNFFEIGHVSTESMNACSDLIFLTACPYTDGEIYFEIPNNDADFSGGVTHMSSHEGRFGVIAFDGTGEMNAGNDLLHTPDIKGEANTGEFAQFTFGTWMWVDDWESGSYVFCKEASGKQIALKLGATVGQFIYEVNNAQLAINASNFTTGAWQHIAFAYHNEQGVSFFLNGNSVLTNDKSSIQGKVPFIRAQMKLGKNFKGKLDETFFHGLKLSLVEIQTIKNNGIIFNNWNATKTLAYWKFDDVSNYGKDEQSWVTILDNVRSQLASREIKLRLGISSGDWKGMCSMDASRTAFANNVKKILEKYQFNGVDLDFEWPLNQEEYNNYSATIIKVKSIIGNNYTYSVSLHPLYYRISQMAIDAVDYISMQSYGPRPERFSYETFTNEAEMAVNYGFPRKKLIMGVPFYGAAANMEGTVAYRDFVNAGLITSEDIDQVAYNGKVYTFNGQTTIRKKTRYVREQNLAGMMAWDLATDVPFSHPKSLLKAMVEEARK
jgi:hypothetical protein